MILVIVVTMASVLAVACSVYVHSRVVAEARVKVVAAARTECNKSASRVKKAQAAFTKTVRGKKIANLLKLNSSQVSDVKTLKTLKKSVKADSTVALCNATMLTGLEQSTKKNNAAVKTIASQTARVTVAAQSVEKSHKAKVAADKKKAEEKRRAEQVKKAQAAKRQQPQSVSTQSTQTVAPSTGSRSYTPTYSAPQRSFSAPRSSYCPAPQVRHSNPAPKKSSGDNMGWEDLGCFTTHTGDPNDPVHEGC